MPNMREALRNALIKTPDPKLSMALRDAEHSQYQERKAGRHARELEKLGGRFQYVGNMWLNRIMGNPIPISIGDLRREWEKELLPRLANTEESERPQLISKLADGLMLSENLNSIYRVTAARAIFNNPLGKLSQMLITKRLSPASKVFLESISEISGYSKKQKSLFGTFINRREDLRGFVTLRQTFPAVAQWLVQSRNSSQSSKLS